MFFKDAYRKYKANEAKKRMQGRKRESIDRTESIHSISTERESQYFDLSELQSIYSDLDQITKQINQLKASIRHLQKHDRADTRLQFQESLVRAFELERNEISLKEFNKPYF